MSLISKKFVCISAILIILASCVRNNVVLAKPIDFDLGGIVDQTLSGIVFDDEKNLALNGWPSVVAGTLDTAMYPDMLYFAEFASATYCTSNHIPGTAVNCPNSYCPHVTANNVTTIIDFENKGATDTTGIVARDDTTKSIVVAFRGSKSLRNWLTNAMIIFRPVEDICAGCRMHSGFHDAINEEFPGILKAVQGLVSSFPEYKIVITGHSLGGALAAVAASQFRKLGHKVTLYTYGAPRIGNNKLSAFISLTGPNFRVTHLDDPVPRLPPIISGYEHISPEYHIFRGDFPILPPDINILEGGVNLGGNTGTGEPISLNTSAHGHYLLPTSMSGCAGDSGIEIKLF